MLDLTSGVITIVGMIAEGMAPKTAVLLLLFAYGSCMEMKETVERMVIVRTTGSDLQPAATGYIYKKENDGAASVIKMGETEVIDHFSKLYSKPEAYKAPIPAAAGSFHAKEEDEVKSASYTNEEQVKPVVENVKEHGDGHIDGIADEDYDKMFEEYAKQFRHYKDDFADYLHGVGHYDHGIYHGHGGGKDYGLKGYHGHGDKGHEGQKKIHHFEKGNAGDYHSEKHEAYSVSKQGGHKKKYGDADDHGKHFAYGQGYKGDDHGHKAGHSNGEGIDGFQKLYDEKAFKKDYDFYDGEGLKGNLHKYASGYSGYGSGARGYENGDAHKSGHHEGAYGKDGFIHNESGEENDEGHSSDENGESGHHHQGNFGTKSDDFGGKSYGYKVKH